MEDILSSIKNIAEWGIWGGAAYTISLLGAQATTYFVSPRIKSEADLVKVVSKEREKLKDMIDRDTVITTSFGERSCVKRLRENCYHISLSESLANESTVRHELYHIADKHHQKINDFKSKFMRNITFFFWYEAKATIYETTGARL